MTNNDNNNSVISQSNIQAPENLLVEDRKNAEFHSDVWSTALVAVEMLTGKPPWGEERGDPIAWVYSHINAKKLPGMLGRVRSDDVRQNLQRALSYEPDERPSASDMRDYLRKASTKGR